jgi:hypothetical protein
LAGYGVAQGVFIRHGRLTLEGAKHSRSLPVPTCGDGAGTQPS